MRPRSTVRSSATGTTFETWEERGAKSTPERANQIWKDILANFEAPPLDEAIHDELVEFVDRRKKEGGAPTEF